MEKIIMRRRMIHNNNKKFVKEFLSLEHLLDLFVIFGFLCHKRKKNENRPRLV